MWRNWRNNLVGDSGWLPALQDQLGSAKRGSSASGENMLGRGRDECLHLKIIRYNNKRLSTTKNSKPCCVFAKNQLRKPMPLQISLWVPRTKTHSNIVHPKSIEERRWLAARSTSCQLLKSILKLELLSSQTVWTMPLSLTLSLSLKDHHRLEISCTLVVPRPCLLGSLVEPLVESHHTSCLLWAADLTNP